MGPRSRANPPRSPSLSTARPGPGRAARRQRLVAGARRRPADDRRLVLVGDDDIDPAGQLAEDRGRLGLGPQPAAQVDVEADRDAGRASGRDCQLDGLPARCRQRRGDPAEMEPAGGAEDPAALGLPDVVGTEARTGRRRPGVVDLRRTQRPPFANHEAGRADRVHDQPLDVDALAAQCPDDPPAEPVVADPADEGDPPAQPGQADRHVRLGAGGIRPERRRGGQRSELAGHERDQALAQGDDLRTGPGHAQFRGLAPASGRHRGAPSLARTGGGGARAGRDGRPADPSRGRPRDRVPSGRRRSRRAGGSAGRRCRATSRC